MAPKYNEEIYVTVDNYFDCTFVIGKKRENIEEMDLTLLSNFFITIHKRIIGKFAYEKEAWKQLVSQNFDAYITTMEPYNFSLWALKLYCIITHKQIIYWTHGWYGNEPLFKRILKKIDYRTTSAFLLYGNYAKQLMIKEGFDENNLFVIHNSLNYSKQIALRKDLVPNSIYKNHFNNENPTIIFIGRLTKIKRLDLIINAIAEMKAIGNPYNLVFVGDGTERLSLEMLTKSKGLDKTVWFYGACYEEKRNAELIFNADICVSPGNVGLTAIHSLMFGCPVITHDNFSMQMPEFESIKEGVTGAFFHESDLQSLKEVIQKWYNNKKHCREEVRRACYKEIDCFWNPKYEIEVLKQALKIDD